MMSSEFAALTLLAALAVVTCWVADFDPSASLNDAQYFQMRDQRDMLSGLEEQLRDKRSPADEDEVIERSKRQIIRPIGPIRPCNGNELCCGKKVFRGQFDYSAQCCGENFYDTSTARCCQNIVLPTLDSNLQCCGKVLYNQSKQLCCNGVQYDIQKNQQCCDTKTFNPLKQVCCNGTITDIGGKILSCCNKQAYEPVRSHCINGVVRDIPPSFAPAVTQVCANDIIDFKSKICCDGVIQDLVAGEMTVCCGQKAISSVKQLCCNGTVISDPAENAICCVKTTFDPNSQVCCNGKVYKRPVNSVGTINYCQTLVPQFDGMKAAAYSPYYQCCGDQLFTDTQTQLCCNDKLYSYKTSNDRYSYSCCAATAYKTSDQTCCVDKLFAGQQRCCNRTPYDLNKQVCCGNSLFAHNSVPPNQCCATNPTVQPIFSK